MFLIPQILVLGLIFLMVAFRIEGTLAQVRIKEESKKERIHPLQQEKLGERRKRNPFFLPPGVYPLSKGSASSVSKERREKSDTKFSDTEFAETSPLPLTVKAILISDHIRLASIGEHIVAERDKINDERVLEIKNDRIILGKGDKRRTLLLHQSPMKLTVEEK
jgi:hypothetical protein